MVEGFLPAKYHQPSHTFRPHSAALIAQQHNADVTVSQLGWSARHVNNSSASTGPEEQEDANERHWHTFWSFCPRSRASAVKFAGI
jgi:hypothetical protein